MATHAYLLPWNNENWMSPLTDAGVSEVRCPSAKTTKRFGVCLGTWELLNVDCIGNEHSWRNEGMSRAIETLEIGSRKNTWWVETSQNEKEDKCVCCGIESKFLKLNWRWELGMKNKRREMMMVVLVVVVEVVVVVEKDLGASEGGHC